MNNSRLTEAVGLVGNAAQIIIATSIVVDLIMRIKNGSKKANEETTDDVATETVAASPQTNPA